MKPIRILMGILLGILPFVGLPETVKDRKGAVLGDRGNLLDDPRRIYEANRRGFREGRRIGKDRTALFVKHVGQYGEHATAKKADFENDDVIVGVADDSTGLSEGEFIGRLLERYRAGEEVVASVYRGRPYRRAETPDAMRARRESPVGPAGRLICSAAPSADGRLALGAGRRGGVLRVRQSQDTPPRLRIRVGSSSNGIEIDLLGRPTRSYRLEVSSNLRDWRPVSLLPPPDSTGIATVSDPVAPTLGAAYYRAVEAPPHLPADVVAVQASGPAGAYTFSVTLSSPDTGCSQYADWWEVLDENGYLVYRRTLAHSHVEEQPFTRTGGPVRVEAGDLLWVRAHMHPNGFGGVVFQGSVSEGFAATPLPPTFASGNGALRPWPPQCAF